MRENLPKYLKSLRKDANLTQAQLAALVNVQRYNIAKYETGRTVPRGTSCFGSRKP